MEIRIDRGYKSYDVTDADGTVLGTVRLNLADAGLMGRFEEARRKIEAMVQDAGVDANPDTMIAVDKAIKEQLDYAFGAEVSPVFFGGMSSLALCEDGELVPEKVMEAVVPIFEDATGKAVAASNARKAQRLENTAINGSALPPASRYECLGSARHCGCERAAFCYTVRFPSGAGRTGCIVRPRTDTGGAAFYLPANFIPRLGTAARCPGSLYGGHGFCELRRAVAGTPTA